jgi:ribosomal protein S12 methylthiotransferase accessory factor
MTAQDTAALYRSRLPEGVHRALPTHPIDPLNRGTDEPLVHCSLEGLGTAAFGQFTAYGYGATPGEAARGAAGELTEETQNCRALATAETVRDSYKSLSNARGARHVLDPRAMVLPAGCDWTPDTPLTWAAATRPATGEAVWVPAVFLAIKPHQIVGGTPLPDELTAPITNGLGAGTSPEMAVAHGLCELLQRDGNGTRFRAMDRHVAVDLGDGALLSADTRALLNRLDDAGLEVTVKLANTQFGLTNVYVQGPPREDREDEFPLLMTAAGEACDLDPARAIRKALLEFAAARSRKLYMHGPLGAVEALAPSGYLDRFIESFKPDDEEPRSLAAMRDWVTADPAALRDLFERHIFPVERAVPLADLPGAGEAVPDDPLARLSLLLDRLSGEAPGGGDFDVLIYNASPPGDDVFAVKALVPGLEVEQMSYRRLGERGVADLIARGVPWAGVGDSPRNALRLPLTPEAESRLGGPAWLDPAGQDAAVGSFYPLYREPNTHAVQLAPRGR